MKESEFEQFCHAHLMPRIREFAAEARADLKWARIRRLLALPLVPAAAVFGWYLYRQDGEWESLLWPVVGAVFLVRWLAKPRVKNYKQRFADHVISPLVAKISPGSRYQARGKIEEAELDTGLLLPGRIKRLKGEDLVEGRIGKTGIRFSEVAVECEKGFLARLGGSNDERPDFQGVYLVADFPKRFSGITVVLPDTMEETIGRMAHAFQKLQARTGSLVKLEDPEFERAFVVYSDDQVEARYILSTSLMERIMELRKTARSVIMLSFANRKLHLAIEGKKISLTPPDTSLLIRAEEDYAWEVLEDLKKYLRELSLGLEVVETLNLNTRIWRT